MKNPLIILCLIVFSTRAYACPSDQKKIVEEFVKEEFSGRRLQAKSSCLEQSRFSHIKIAHDPPNEEAIESVWVKPETLVIDKVELIDADIKVYSAHFQVQFSSDQGKTWATTQDMIKYMANQNQAGRCALLLQSPQKLMIESRCLTSDKD